MTWTLLLPIVWGLLSRLHGSSLEPPKVYDSLVYATPIALICMLALPSVLAPIWLDVVVYVVVLGLTALAKSAPHGAFLDDGFVTGEYGIYTPTWLTRTVDVVTFGASPSSRLWCSAGWAIKGALIALPSALAFAYLHHYGRASAILVCGTASSAIGYALGWTVLRNKPKWMRATMWGEFLSGFIAGLGYV